MKGLNMMLDHAMDQIQVSGFMLPEYDEEWTEKDKRYVTHILTICLKALMAAREAR